MIMKADQFKFSVESAEAEKFKPVIDAWAPIIKYEQLKSIKEGKNYFNLKGPEKDINIIKTHLQGLGYRAFDITVHPDNTKTVSFTPAV